jgi:tRNA nucleotidyltransferase (CCA-adding enzyme)
VVQDLAYRVYGVKGRAFLVGGSVRDHLLGRPFKDWDLEVFGVPADDLQTLLKRLGRVNLVGRSFGVYKLTPRGTRDEIDVSIPRRDSRVGPGHKGIEIEGDPDMSVSEAARRRDLTVNAILYDLHTGEVVDPHNGVADLGRGVLRAVDRETFLEDPLRALRAVQFAARLDFQPDAELVGLCRQAPLDELPAERVCWEWEKLLLRGVRPSRGMQLAREANILERVFPEAAGASPPGVDEVLDRLAANPHLPTDARRWIVMLAGWLAAGSQAQVKACLDRLGLHRWGGVDVRTATLALVDAWSLPVATQTDLRRLATHTRVEWALWLREALDPTSPMDGPRHMAAGLGVLTKPLPALIGGRDLGQLGIPPGRHMGVLLREVYDAQLTGEIQEKTAALERAAAIWSETAAG